MSSLRKLCQLNVTATSPDRGVRATATAGDGISVAIAPKAMPIHDVKTLAGQVSAAVRGVLRGMRRGEADILRGAMSEFGEGSAEHAALSETPRSSHTDPPDVEVMVVSETGNVKMRMDGHDSAEVRIRPDSLARVATGDLVRDINHTVAATVREYGRRAAESRKRHTKDAVSDVR